MIVCEKFNMWKINTVLWKNLTQVNGGKRQSIMIELNTFDKWKIKILMHIQFLTNFTSLIEMHGHISGLLYNRYINMRLDTQKRNQIRFGD